MVRKLMIAAVITGSIPAAAHAGEIYFGASAGQTTFRKDQLNVDFDAKDTSYKLYGGFRFLKFFGLEGSRLDLGTPDDTAGAFTFRSDVSGWDAFAVGVLPLGRLELFAKAGVVYWEADSTTTSVTTTVTDSDDGVDSAYGFGAAFKFAKLLALRAEWERFDISGAEEFYLASLGLDIRF